MNSVSRKSTLSAQNRIGTVHVDVDSLESIYEAHGGSFSDTHVADTFFVRGLENCCTFFDEQGITATFFVVARDLERPVRKSALMSVVSRGHAIASHSMTHANIPMLPQDKMLEEVVQSRENLEQALSCKVLGFRAPGYHIDSQTLDFVHSAGYVFDSSAFVHQVIGVAKERSVRISGPLRIRTAPDLLEFPVARVNALLPPFHPCYAFALSNFYHDISLRMYARSHMVLVYLFHLTDFSDVVSDHASLKMKVFTNAGPAWPNKRSRLDHLVRKVRACYALLDPKAFMRQCFVGTHDIDPHPSGRDTHAV